MKNSTLISLLAILILLSTCQNKSTPLKDSKSLAFIGTYTQKEGHVDGKGAGVLIYETGPKAADWKQLGVFSDIINPSFLCHSPKHPIIYSVSEQGTNVPEPKSVIKVLQYNENFEITELQSISAQGHAPCYISTDRTGSYAYVANYITGNIVQYSIKKDGTLANGKSIQHTGSGPNPRQEGPHAHFVKQHPSQYDIYALDLGTDQILKYRTINTVFQKTDSIQTEAGAGPRHLVWHPSGEHAYVLNELSGTIEGWQWQDSLKNQFQNISLKGDRDSLFAGSADIHISRDGQFVYACLRGDFNEIIVLKTHPELYTLEVTQRVSAGGEVPRNFAISPNEDYLAVALQNSDRIMLFERDQESGMLKEPAEAVDIKTPVCVVFN